ncbi:hypothetical protein ACFYY2_15825 [Streptomyces sp. NPDC001822]|uniref:hypothetical protein n=1 Tax=Streptomyces sp. NPDC001822 TaxID=3364614 RepID=UPI00369D7427
MATHATTPTRRRQHARTPVREGHTPLAWAVPVSLGVILGFWAFFIKRDGGTTTDGQIVLGVVSGVAYAVLCYAFVMIRRALPRELRAAGYAVLAGGAIGYLFSLNGNSVFSSSGLGLVIGAGTFLTMFYIHYTHEE